MSDQYANWRKRLAGEKIPTYDGVVDPGFYRKKNKDKETKTVTYEPVAFWLITADDGGPELVGVCGKRVLDARGCEELWTWVCANPISEETFRAVSERGEAWPGTDPVVAKQGKSVAEMREENPNFDRDLERTFAMIDAKEADKPEVKFAADIAEAKKGIEAYRSIDSDEMAAKAQDLRSHLTGLGGKADKLRSAEKEPFLQGGKEVDAKWQPIVKDAKDGADALRKAIEGWELEKRKAARLAQEAAEKLARERAAEAAQKGNPEPAPEPAPVASNAPAPSAQIRGASGRAASVKEAWEAVITDQDKLYHVVRSEPELIAVMQKMAQRMVDAGLSPAGVEKKETVRVR